MGTPSPHVTLYLNGHPLRTEVTRHMVTDIHNVTRDMEHVSCYADNGLVVKEVFFKLCPVSFTMKNEET